jgi:CHAD domain-containing protein
MTFKISSKPFAAKQEENIQRVNNRIENYLTDPNKDNIHDIRTAIRKLDASYRSLPKKIRKKNRVSNYVKVSKRLFKINSEIRDYDIIYEKLKKYSSNSIYTELTRSLDERRDKKIRKARNIALSLTDLQLPQVSEDDIPTKKLQQRFNKTVTRFSDRIELNFPIVLTNSKKIAELHEMRKDCKKLRYLLELLPDENKEMQKTITELEDIQDMLGSIHDDDITIAYLKSTRNPKAVRNILDNEVVQRNHKYEEFIQFCKANLSNPKESFFNQIWSLA